MNVAVIIHTHKPWVAGLMSLALPGWGQLYNGEANRAIWYFLAFALLLLPGTALLALWVPPMLMAPALILGVLGALGLWGYGVIDAYRRARQRRLAYAVKPWQTSGLYVLVFIACALLVLPSMTAEMRAHLVQPFRIPSSSMAPNLLPGDFVFADMHYNCHTCRAVQRGDVAIFTFPNDRTQYQVKRIVALPGDRVSMQNHRLMVNGVVLAVATDGSTQLEQTNGKTWQVEGMATVADTDSEMTVAPGQVYLLGDMRSTSIDSRKFGTVPLADVVGRVRQIWFSSGDEGIRWGRIGQLVN